MPRKIIRDVFLRGKEEERPLVEELEMEKQKKSRFLFKFAILVFILVLLGAFGYVALNRFLRPLSTFLPYRETLAIDSRLRAYANPATTGLSFETMRLSSEESGLVTATGISSGGQKSERQNNRL